MKESQTDIRQDVKACQTVIDQVVKECQVDTEQDDKECQTDKLMYMGETIDKCEKEVCKASPTECEKPNNNVKQTHLEELIVKGSDRCDVNTCNSSFVDSEKLSAKQFRMYNDRK